MGKIIKRTAILMIFVFWVTHASILRAAEDTIIAIVNSEVITLQDLNTYLTAMYVQLLSDGKSETEAKEFMREYEQTSLEQLINDKLLVNEANQKEMVVKDKSVDERMDAIKQRYGSAAEFERALLAEGITTGQLKKKIIEQIKIKFLIDREVRSKIFVSPSEVTDYYQKNIERFKTPQRVDLQSIFIPYDPDMKTAKQKAEEALQRLQKGEEFSAIESEYSKTPSIGVIAEGQMLPKLNEAAFSLNQNEISPLIETDNGIYILMVKEKYPPEQLALEQVKSKVFDIVFQEKYQKRLADWLDELRKKTYVEIKTP